MRALAGARRRTDRVSPSAGTRASRAEGEDVHRGIITSRRRVRLELARRRERGFAVAESGRPERGSSAETYCAFGVCHSGHHEGPILAISLRIRRLERGAKPSCSATRRRLAGVGRQRSASSTNGLAPADRAKSAASPISPARVHRPERSHDELVPLPTSLRADRPAVQLHHAVDQGQTVPRPSACARTRSRRDGSAEKVRDLSAGRPVPVSGSPASGVTTGRSATVSRL